MASRVDEPTQELAQFEPDPDGQGVMEAGSASSAPSGEPDDPQWIVWTDAEGESAWAETELEQIGAAWRP